MHWRQRVFRFPELPIPDGHWRPWSPEPKAPAVRDDPRICPLQVHGQMSWPSAPRALTVEHAQRIMDREFPELPALTAVIAQMTAERNLSDAWERLALHMARLVLAVREADQPLVSEQDIAQLPQLRGPLVEAFRRSGLLRRRPNSWHLALHPQLPAVSCEHCMSWSGTTAKLCAACKNWRRSRERGACRRCHRTLPLSPWDAAVAAASSSWSGRWPMPRSLTSCGSAVTSPSLLAWLGTGTAILERDVVGVGDLSPYYRVGQAPAQFQADLHTWIAVLRGHGKRPSPPMRWDTIRGYALHVVSVLGTWEHLASLGEVTEQEVKTAAVNYSVFTSLRSLFRALRRERRIFRDPARNVHLTTPVRVPRPIPADRLKGLLNQAGGAKDRLALVLMAVYAVRPKQVAEILLDDLDRCTGRLRIRRPNRLDHVICLDEFALQLVKDWLAERHRRWPLSTNPYLIVSPLTALHINRPSVGIANFSSLRDRIGINFTQLRQDRFLDEARETADPVRLMRLFGITSYTAIHYVRTAHPERFTIDPTQA